MSEYIVELNNNAVSGGKFLLGSVYLDATAIVRCRDCKLCVEYENKSGKKKWCRNNLRYVSDDGFCAWGERRES